MEELNRKPKHFWKDLGPRIKTGIIHTYHSEGFKTVLTSFWCALIGLIIGFIILLLINANNAADGILATLKNFFVFSSREARLRYFGQTLAKTAPLLVTSVAIIFSYKAGIFNIGGSGQYTIAVIVISYFGIAFKLNWFLVMILAMIGGAIWGCLIGLLKAFFNVNEVISAIMLNWIALYIANAVLTTDPIIWDGSHSESFKITPGNPAFMPNLGLDKVFGNNVLAGIGLFIALITVIIVYIVLKKTTFGYQIQATGLNPNAAKYAGINEKKNMIIVTAISGALVGLAASLSLQNSFTSWQLSSTCPSIGFDGIAAAFLGGLSPIGAIFASYFITHITDGGSMITDLGYAPQVANIMTSIIIYLSGVVAFIKTILNKKEIKPFDDDISPREAKKKGEAK